MARPLSKALIAAATLLLAAVLAVMLQYQLRPRLMLGEPLTLHFSKGVFINCLRQPEEDILIRRVGWSGIHVVAVTSRLKESFAMPDWAPGCAALGIVAGTQGPGSYFIPFSVIESLQSEGRPVWRNPLGA